MPEIISSVTVGRNAHPIKALQRRRVGFQPTATPQGVDKTNPFRQPEKNGQARLLCPFC
ncbi:MAG: hypothetical protein IKI11_09990 [Neisseriaceae bacterium]|nr:hypothetical protein [Neisseriaceae bacterium]